MAGSPKKLIFSPSYQDGQFCSARHECTPQLATDIPHRTDLSATHTMGGALFRRAATMRGMGKAE
jgi:hypothetical protein